MIDNVILLMNGALQSKPVKDILGKCHPLGHFTEMEAVNIAETPSDLFNAILVETPLGTSAQVTVRLFVRVITPSENALATHSCLHECSVILYRFLEGEGDIAESSGPAPSFFRSRRVM